MLGDAFQNWRREREAIEREMDHLITEGVPASIEERQVRRTRFVALIERREAAARELLYRGRASGRDKSPKGSYRPDSLIPGTDGGAGAEGDQAKFVPLADEKGEVEASHVTTDEAPADIVALAGDAVAVPPGPAEASAAGVPVAEPASDVVGLTPRATSDSAVVLAAGLPSDVPGPSTDVVALAADATALAPESAAIPAAGLPADTADPSADVVVHASDAAALAPESAAVPTAGLPAEVAEASADVIAHAPDAPVSVPAVGLPSDAAELPTDDVALAADAGTLPPAADGVRAEGTELPADLLLAHYVAAPPASYSSNTVANPANTVANCADAVPRAGDAKTDDLLSDPSLLKLLRRLQSKLSRAGEMSR
jgi:hypothetical protein